MRSFVASGTYWSEYDGDVGHDFRCIIVAEDYVAAMKSLSERLSELVKVTIEEGYDDDQFIWLDKQHYEDYVSHQYSFDQANEEVEEGTKQDDNTSTAAIDEDVCKYYVEGPRDWCMGAKGAPICYCGGDKSKCTHYGGN